jgi:hypothetical protein
MMAGNRDQPATGTQLVPFLAEHASQVAREWEDVGESYVRKRMHELGIPDNQIGEPDYGGSGRLAMRPGGYAARWRDKLRSGAFPCGSQQFGPSLESFLGEPIKRIPAVPEAVTAGHQSGALQLAEGFPVGITSIWPCRCRSRRKRAKAASDSVSVGIGVPP